ncbi:MAG TPA: DUF4199 family protein [Opitutaceae bacterium]|nr:DUF4199 family protein [Opitutaceae bacterium]
MRPELGYGLVAGAGMGGWLLLEYALGLHTRHLAAASYTHWGTELILVTMLYLLLRRQLRRLNRYWLPVWEGVLYGSVASFVAALAFYVFAATYLYFINPDWPDVRLAFDVAAMRDRGVPEEQVREYARLFRRAFSPVGLAVTIPVAYTVLGAVASSVLTLWVNWRHKERIHAG